jgi:hypothetical protein
MDGKTEERREFRKRKTGRQKRNIGDGDSKGNKNREGKLKRRKDMEMRRE